MKEIPFIKYRNVYIVLNEGVSGALSDEYLDALAELIDVRFRTPVLVWRDEDGEHMELVEDPDGEFEEYPFIVVSLPDCQGYIRFHPSSGYDPSTDTEYGPEFSSYTERAAALWMEDLVLTLTE